MEKPNIIKLLNEIKGAYGYRFEVNEHTATAWYKYLQEQDSSDVFNKLDHYIRNNDNPPTLKDLVKHKDPELEARKVEIARNKWIAEGNDPNEFEYGHASNH